MTYDATIHHRRSIRLNGYDYSRSGAYFITICVQDKLELFGKIESGKMILNPAGEMIQTVWSEMPDHYSGIAIADFAILPNHVHGIIRLEDITHDASTSTEGKGVSKTRLSLPDAVHRFKTMTTKRYVDGVKRHGWRPFPGRLWQRNYWEHVVRGETDLYELQEYIRNNPKRWDLDRLNQAACVYRQSNGTSTG